MLTLTGVSKAFGPRVVLHEVSLLIPDDARLGVVGPNGIGKSTLLRIMAGEETPDSGAVVRAPAGLRVGLLDQRGRIPRAETVAAHIARRTGVAAAEARLDALTAALEHDPAAIDDYSAALDDFLALGGADLEARSRETVAEVGLGARLLETPMPGLSGGQAARVGLAVLLLSRVDLLLLDEPTNDLDFAGLALLERIVAAHRGAVVTVSHDRAFLDAAVTRIAEVVEPDHTLREWAGGWSDYVAQRDVARGRQYEAHGRYAAERDRLGARMRRQRAWSEEGVRRERRRAASGSDPDKLGRAARSERSEQQAGKVRATERAMERLEAVDKPWEGWRLQLRLPAAQGGDLVGELAGAVVRRGSFTLGPVDLHIARGDRVVVTGPNGGGKSTLIAALTGRIAPQEGAARRGPAVVMGEVEQDRTSLLAWPTLLDAVVAATGLRAQEARTLLAKFALDADRVVRPAGDLSPGERTRALLAVLAAREVGCLVLDEPTNHLDLEAIEQLEEALDGYGGTLLLVTHDRRMLERVRITRRLEVVDGRVTEHPAPSPAPPTAGRARH